MGVLKDKETGLSAILEPHTVIGRDPRCSLRVMSDWVSTQHATLRWTGGGWEIRDLSSRNGTFLDGERITPGLAYVLRVGSQLSFGKRSAQAWILSDGAGPVPMATPIAGGPPALMEGDVIAVPTADAPLASILADEEGWVLEDHDGTRTLLSSGDVFTVSGAPWRFTVPSDMPSPTRLASSMIDLDVKRIHLSFRVSADEETVALQIDAGGVSRDAGLRSFNYLLLTLARRRLEDMKDGYPDSECGWFNYADFTHDESMAAPQVALNVCRIRKHFAKLGVADAPRIIERRPRTRQLRIGTGALTVTGA
jgi:pSer/pThr/pTyr-binding forkhead associated (FHA) protein